MTPNGRGGGRGYRNGAMALRPSWIRRASHPKWRHYHFEMNEIA